MQHVFGGLPNTEYAHSEAIMASGSKCGKEMLGKIRWVWAFAYLFCTCLFLYQLVKILPDYFAPTMTHTEVKDVPLKDMDFPLSIKVCFRPSVFNSTALKQLGYVDSAHYILGRSKFNDDLYVIGWGGHNNQSNPVKNASEVLQTIKRDWTRGQIFGLFQVTTTKDVALKDLAEKVSLQRINWINECYLLNMSLIENENLMGAEAIGMFVDNTLLKGNVSVELELEGQNLAAHRDIQDHKFYHSGDAIKLEKYTSYRVKIKKRVFVEGDPGRTCRNYPNSEFQSYMECDDQYMRDRVDKVAPGLNLKPVWMTDDLSKVTIEPVIATLQILGHE